ncbi:C40 family peptidase [Calidithermus timidus]|jgi:cell wall-associated NlpC family hydrolase|uniref:C40 family peptidase n=1 Tax=Calidithermus timidus TaxID=307124 RepID=UPI000368A670|nr:C40 family peptidase [Calidithermus timidus]
MKAKALLPWLLGAALCTQAFIVAQGNTAPPPSQATYIVQRGDTLYSIARRFGTTVATLMELNGLTSSALSPGQVLKLPNSAPTPKAQPKSTASEPIPNTYTVQRGDTLYSIAKRFGSSVEALITLNGLNSPTLEVGQVLKLHPEAAKAGEATAEAGGLEYDPNHPLMPVILKYLGLVYKYGSNSDSTLDCSAFVQRVYADIGVHLPRTSREQYAALPEVAGELRQGDLVFFSFGGKDIDHVGIYLGRGVFAHANSYASRVVIEGLSTPYYQKTYRGARRPDLSAVARTGP